MLLNMCFIMVFLQRDAVVPGGGADAYPVHVALAHVPEALGLVDGVVHLPLKDALEVLLHLPACHVHHDAYRHPAALVVEVLPALADDGYLVVLHLLGLPHPHKLEGRGALAAELDEHVLLADALALEGGAVGHRDGWLLDDDLQAPDLDGLLDDLLVVELLVHLLVGADTGGMDDRDVRVSDGGKAHVDGPRAGGPLGVVKLAEDDGEGEDAVLLVHEVLPELAWLLAAEDE
jgi:hypothetical protein